jgi:hypothetical protein
MAFPHAEAFGLDGAVVICNFGTKFRERRRRAQLWASGTAWQQSAGVLVEASPVRYLVKNADVNSLCPALGRAARLGRHFLALLIEMAGTSPAMTLNGPCAQHPEPS